MKALATCLSLDCWRVEARQTGGGLDCTRGAQREILLEWAAESLCPLGIEMRVDMRLILSADGAASQKKLAVQG